MALLDDLNTSLDAWMGGDSQKGSVVDAIVQIGLPLSRITSAMKIMQLTGDDKMV